LLPTWSPIGYPELIFKFPAEDGSYLDCKIAIDLPSGLLERGLEGGIEEDAG